MRSGVLLIAAFDDRDEVGGEDPLRAEYVIKTTDHSGVRIIRVGQLVKGEVIGNDKFIEAGDIHHSIRSSDQLMCLAVIRSCVVVACRTGLNSVTSCLHIPEQRFSQHDGRIHIGDEIKDVSRQRHRHHVHRIGSLKKRLQRRWKQLDRTGDTRALYRSTGTDAHAMDRIHVKGRR